MTFLLGICGIDAQCTYVHFGNDPTTWGGGNCTSVLDCGLVGKCFVSECVCPPARGGPNCQYMRYQSHLQGGLLFGLAIIGFGFISNLMTYRIGQGVGQLLLYFSGLALIIIGIKRFGSCGKLRGTYYSWILVIIGIICICASVCWQITDGVLVWDCRIPDGNGYGFYDPTNGAYFIINKRYSTPV